MTTSTATRTIRPAGSMLTISGPAIVRKNGQPAPAFINAGALGLAAIYAAFEQANHAYESFVLDGNADAVLAFKLIATARGVAFKLSQKLAAAPAAHEEDAASTVVSFIQRKSGAQHLPAAWAALGDAGPRAEALAVTLAEALGAAGYSIVSAEAASNSVSQYLNVLTPAGKPLAIRISDHGLGQAGVLTLSYTLRTAAAVALVNAAAAA